MEPYEVSLPAGVTTTDLDRAFAAETVASEDSNAFTIKSRETLLKAPEGGPYPVSLYRYDTARYHRRPVVVLSPNQDGRSVTVTWSDATERQFWMMTIAAGAICAVAAIISALSITLLGLVFALPALMMVVVAQRSYRSSDAVQRKDCEDAVAVAMRAARSSTPKA